MNEDLNQNDLIVLARKRADEIIERNANPKICITCREEILDGSEIKTIHGYYHGGDRTCVEGREMTKEY